jgi:hypothetical protein
MFTVDSCLMLDQKRRTWVVDTLNGLMYLLVFVVVALACFPAVSRVLYDGASKQTSK